MKTGGKEAVDHYDWLALLSLGALKVEDHVSAVCLCVR